MEEVPCRTSLVPFAFPCFVHCFLGVETEGLLDYHGRAGDHFHCTVEPSSGHFRCRTFSCRRGSLELLLLSMWLTSEQATVGKIAKAIHEAQAIGAAHGALSLGQMHSVLIIICLCTQLGEPFLSEVFLSGIALVKEEVASLNLSFKSPVAFMSNAPDPLCSQKGWRKITLVNFKEV